MTKWVFFILFPALSLVIFGIVYYLDNSTYEANTSISYPYVLSVKPNIVKTGQFVNISFYSVNDSINPVDFTIDVISPDGNHFKPKVTKLQLTYPSDFIDSSCHLTGKYDIILHSQSNKTFNMRVAFNAESFPILSEISNFIFTNGIAVSFGLIGIMLTIIYQFISQRYQDRARRLESKSKLMLDNLRYYYYRQRDSWNIIKNYDIYRIKDFSKEPKFRKLDFENILYFTIKYCKSRIQFEDTIGPFYFEDFATERFIHAVDNNIMEMIGYMIRSPYSLLKQFWNNESGELLDREKIVNSPSFMEYKKNTATFLNMHDNKLEFYRLLYVFSHLMFLSINAEVLITYDNRSKNEKIIKRSLQKNLPLLQKYLDDLNKRYYDEEKDYFRLPQFVKA